MLRNILEEITPPLSNIKGGRFVNMSDLGRPNSRKK